MRVREKIEYLAGKTGKTTSEIIREAVELYSRMVGGAREPLSIFKETGFLKSVDGASDLSESHMTEFDKSLRKKHRRHR